jgi:hypothetical protein
LTAFLFANLIHPNIRKGIESFRKITNYRCKGPIEMAFIAEFHIIALQRLTQQKSSESFTSRRLRQGFVLNKI